MQFEIKEHKMSIAATKRITADDYLTQERLAVTKSEFLDGQVFAMAGSTAEHSLIKANAVRALGNAMADGPCRVYDSDMRVQTNSGLFTYPDASVVCDPPEFLSDRRDVLLNPKVIVEVLSPSTERDDRGQKFRHYRSISTLEEYLLISSDCKAVEHYARNVDGQTWTLSAVIGPNTQIALPTLKLSLSLNELYAKVDVPDALELPDQTSETTKS